MARTPHTAPVVEEPQAPITFVDQVQEDSDDIETVNLPLEELPEGAREKYYEAVGRRKEAIARVRLMTRKAGDAARESGAIITVNEKDYTDYFKDLTLQQRVELPLRRLKSLNRFKATVRVLGGGLSGQADAISLGISRALELFDGNFRKKLKKSGLLSRDPRIKERRKPGLKKARKAPRWAKR